MQKWATHLGWVKLKSGTPPEEFAEVKRNEEKRNAEAHERATQAFMNALWPRPNVYEEFLQWRRLAQSVTPFFVTSAGRPLGQRDVTAEYFNFL